MVFNGSRLVFHVVFLVPGWFFVVFHGSRLIFHGSRSFFHGFSLFQVGFSWFFMVQGSLS